MHAAARSDAGDLEQRFAQAQAPLSGVLRRRRLAQIGKLVAEIPGEERRMVPDALAHPSREENLRLEQRGVGVKVADAAIRHSIAADRAEAARGRVAIERPARQPVHAAHVPAEERRHRAQSGFGDAVHEGVEAAQGRRVHRARSGLKRIPA